MIAPTTASLSPTSPYISFLTTLHFSFASPLRFRCSSLSLTDSGAVAAGFLWRCGGGSGVNNNDGDQPMLDRNPNSSGSDSDEVQSLEIQTLKAELATNPSNYDANVQDIEKEVRKEVDEAIAKAKVWNLQFQNINREEKE